MPWRRCLRSSADHSAMWYSRAWLCFTPYLRLAVRMVRVAQIAALTVWIAAAAFIKDVTVGILNSCVATLIKDANLSNLWHPGILNRADILKGLLIGKWHP